MDAASGELLQQLEGTEVARSSVAGHAADTQKQDHLVALADRTIALVGCNLHPLHGAVALVGVRHRLGRSQLEQGRYCGTAAGSVCPAQGRVELGRERLLGSPAERGP